MSPITTQQQQGAQKAAADKVRVRRGEFQSQLQVLEGEAQGLQKDYQGPAASAFFTLVGGWLEDASAIVKDMESFAGKLDHQETTVNATQEQSASTFSKAATRLSTKA